MHRLANPVQRYAWGSPTAIPEFLGALEDGAPVAEVWMGAHPLAPSVLVADDAEPPPVPAPGAPRAVGATLDAEVASHPRELLGADVLARWGARLPFLLKLLGAGAPLSLQVHPSLEQARAGYAREEALGTARDAPERTYRDPWHKPELVLALTPFRAVCGVRPPGATLAVLDGLGLDGPGGAPSSPTLAAFRDALRRPDPDDAVRAAFDVAAGAGVSELAGACDTLARASAARLNRSGDDGEHAQDDRCVLELQRAHPADVGVLLSVLMHHVTLALGESLFLGAGQLHAYLSGLAVEVMASSDNVLRAGLTRKHVDVAALRAVLDLTPGPLPVLAPRHRGAGLLTYQPPVEDFGIDVVTVGREGTGSGGPLPAEPGPRIVLDLEGDLQLSAPGASLTLRRGQSAFLPAGTDAAVEGHGRLAIARVGRA